MKHKEKNSCIFRFDNSFSAITQKHKEKEKNIFDSILLHIQNTQ